MKDEPIIGMNYFDHQFLRQKDFEAAQKYHIDRLRQHNRSVHGAGVADGLRVFLVSGSNTTILLQLGRAIDEFHYEVALSFPSHPDALPLVRVETSSGFSEQELQTEADVDIIDGELEQADGLRIDLLGIPASGQAGNSVYIKIKGGLKTKDRSQDPGITGDTRIVEQSLIEVGTSPPSGAQLLLAKINRKNNGTIDGSPDLSEVKYVGTLLADAAVIEDAFGKSLGEYRGTGGRLRLSLRQAINALIRGEIPASDERPVSSAPGRDDNIGRGIFFDGTRGILTTWSADLGSSNGEQIFAAYLALNDPNARFVLQQITPSSSGSHLWPHAVSLGSAEGLVVYETQPTATENEKIQMRKAFFATLNASSEIDVATEPTIRERRPFAVSARNRVIILWHEDTTNTWYFKWFDPVTNTLEAVKTQLSSTETRANEMDVYAASDSTHNVWVAFSAEGPSTDPTNTNIQVVQIPADPSLPPTNIESLDSGSSDRFPFVLVDRNEDVWFFWNSISGTNYSIKYRQFVPTTSSWIPPLSTPTPTIPTTETSGNLGPVAIADEDKGIWVFWQSNRSGNQDIWSIRYNLQSRTWGESRQLTSTPEPDGSPFVLYSPDGSLWLFWNRQFGANGELFYRQFFISI